MMTKAFKVVANLKGSGVKKVKILEKNLSHISEDIKNFRSICAKSTSLLKIFMLDIKS